MAGRPAEKEPSNQGALSPPDSSEYEVDSVCTAVTPQGWRRLVFFAYIAGDPSLNEDNLRLFDEEAALAAQTATVSTLLWLEIARYDGAVQKLSFQLLSERLVQHFPQLQLGSEILDTDHPGTIAPGFRNGLVHILGGNK